MPTTSRCRGSWTYSRHFSTLSGLPLRVVPLSQREDRRWVLEVFLGNLETLPRLGTEVVSRLGPYPNQTCGGP